MRAPRRRLGAAGSGEVMAARFRALWRHIASPWRRGTAPLLPLAGLMLLVLLALGWALWAGAARIDEVQRASEARLVGHAAKSLQQTLAQQAHDYTYWDDAVTNLTLAPDPKWIDDNITVLLSRWGYDYYRAWEVLTAGALRPWPPRAASSSEPQ